MQLQKIGTKKVELRIPIELLERAEELATRSFVTRSDVIRMALLEYLRKPSNITKLEAAPGEDVELNQFLLEEAQREQGSGRAGQPDEEFC